MGFCRRFALVRLDSHNRVLFSEYNRAQKDNLTKSTAVRIIEETMRKNKGLSVHKLATEIFNNLFDVCYL